MGIELLRACVVLALVFLSFAHTPVATAPGSHDVLGAAVDMSWCGDAPDDDGAAHAPCHACRLGAGADLPPPCDIALPLPVVADLHYGAVPMLGLPGVPVAHFSARGPPAA